MIPPITLSHNTPARCRSGAGRWSSAGRWTSCRRRCGARGRGRGRRPCGSCGCARCRSCRRSRCGRSCGCSSWGGRGCWRWRPIARKQPFTRVYYNASPCPCEEVLEIQTGVNTNRRPAVIGLVGDCCWAIGPCCDGYGTRCEGYPVAVIRTDAAHSLHQLMWWVRDVSRVVRVELVRCEVEWRVPAGYPSSGQIPCRLIVPSEVPDYHHSASILIVG